MNYAKDHSINESELKACMDAPETQKEIQEMAQEGVAAQIQGTPTVFVNNRLLSGGQLIPILEAVYQSIEK